MLAPRTVIRCPEPPRVRERSPVTARAVQPLRGDERESLLGSMAGRAGAVRWRARIIELGDAGVPDEREASLHRTHQRARREQPKEERGRSGSSRCHRDCAPVTLNSKLQAQAPVGNHPFLRKFMKIKIQHALVLAVAVAVLAPAPTRAQSPRDEMMERGMTLFSQGVMLL